MGNLCNGSNDNVNSNQGSSFYNKNCQICQFNIGKLCTINLILGTYKFHKGSTLLVLTQQQYLLQSPELKEYSLVNIKNVQPYVQSGKKKQIAINKTCPYQNLYLYVLPSYKSQDSKAYFQKFQKIMKQILELTNDLTLQVRHTSEGENGIPNQTIFSVFFQKVLEKGKKQLQINFLTSQQKLINMIRFQIMKLQDYTFTSYLTDQISTV